MSVLTFGRKILDAMGITHELPLSETERSEYIQNLRLLEDRKTQRFLFDHLYMNLDVLDAKTNSLIQFVAILAAIQTWMVGYMQEHKEMVPHVFIIGAFLSYIAGFLFLWVKKVHWSSYSDLQNEDAHALRLLDVRNKRTVRYRIGWQLTVASLICQGIGIDSITYGALPRAGSAIARTLCGCG